MKTWIKVLLVVGLVVGALAGAFVLSVDRYYEEAAKGLRRSKVACNDEKMVRQVVGFARAVGRVGATEDRATYGLDRHCAVDIAVAGGEDEAVTAVERAADDLGWMAVGDRTWRSPTGVEVTILAITPPFAGSVESDVILGGRRE